MEATKTHVQSNIWANWYVPTWSVLFWHQNGYVEGKKGHLIFRHTETRKKHFLQQWQWIVFGRAKPAHPNKIVHWYICMLLDSLILSQKMRHVKFNFIQCKIATCSSSSGCVSCCKIGPTCPHLAQDRPNMPGAWPKKDGFPQHRANFS